MDSKNIIMLLMVLTVLSSTIQPTNASWAALVPALVGKLSGLWQTGDTVFLGRPCKFRVNPKIKRLKLKFAGKMWCPGWVSYTGRSLKSSRSGAVSEAIKDFIKKLISHKQITEAQASSWLQNN